MKKIESLLAPTDFSWGSTVALHVAAHLAHRLGARLDILHVAESLPVFTYGQLANFAAGQAVYEQGMLERAQHELEDHLARLPRGSELVTEAVLRVGSPGLEIPVVARERGSDLIVMTTHGRTGFSHAVIGSVAEKVVRTAPGAVLSLKTPDPSGDLPEALEVKRVLYPTDLSRESLAGMGYAQELVQLFDAELHVLFVMEDPSHYPIAHWEYMPVPTADVFFEHQETAARDRLRELVEKVVGDGSAVEYHLRRGHPYQEIVDHTREAHCDLVVMSTHGRTGLRHALLGSVAEKVVRLAQCPVLTVRDVGKE